MHAIHPALLALLIGCSTQAPEPELGTTAAVLDGSWVDLVIDHPERFASLTAEPGRAGWSALYSNRLADAASSLEGDAMDSKLGRGRALWELSQLHHGFADAAELAWERSFATWSEKSSLPSGSALPCVAGIAALEQGEPQVALAWFRICTGATDPMVVQAADLFIEATPGQPIQGDELPPLIQRYNLHLELRDSGEIQQLLPAAHQPLLTELERRPDGSTLERRFYDPQLLRTLAIGYGLQAEAAFGGEDPLAALAAAPPDTLAAVLFGPVFSGDSVAAEVAQANETPRTLGASSAALEALGLAPALSETDDVDWARNQVRLFDRALDAWSAQARLSASDDGLALLDELQVVRVYRSRVLLALGRKALLADHPWQALAFAQLALDVESSRGVNHVNHPGLQAIIIEAQLRTGHTREALDAIQPLLEAYPALTGLDEVLGDLAILQGLDRYGDSKEN